MSSTIMWLPFGGIMAGSSFVNQQVSGTADELWCIDVVPPDGIDNATKITMGRGTGSGSATIGVAIYNADGSSQITEATFTSSAQNTVQTPATVSAFDITPAVGIRVCACSSSNAAITYRALQGTVGLAGIFRNAFSVTHQGRADGSHLCSSGDPPPTTGSLTPDTSFAPIALLLSTT